jgi:hypothetical protein
VTFFLMACDRNRLATAHSYTMSKRPASCKLVKFESVLPKREYRINSRNNITVCSM